MDFLFDSGKLIPTWVYIESFINVSSTHFYILQPYFDFALRTTEKSLILIFSDWSLQQNTHNSAKGLFPMERQPWTVINVKIVDFMKFDS